MERFHSVLHKHTNINRTKQLFLFEPIWFYFHFVLKVELPSILPTFVRNEIRSSCLIRTRISSFDGANVTLTEHAGAEPRDSKKRTRRRRQQAGNRRIQSCLCVIESARKLRPAYSCCSCYVTERARDLDPEEHADSSTSSRTRRAQSASFADKTTTFEHDRNLFVGSRYNHRSKNTISPVELARATRNTLIRAFHFFCSNNIINYIIFIHKL